MSKHFTRAVLTAIPFVVLFSTVSPAKAQTVYLWSGQGANTNWSTTANWFFVLSPPPSNVNDTILGFADLGLGGTTLSTMDSNFAARGLEFSLGAAVANFTISNGGAFTLTLGVDGILNTSGSHSIGVNIALASAQSWINNSTGLSITGTVANGGNLLTVDGTGNTSISGVISGTGGLTKTGAGILTLGGVNNYSGTTTVSGGTLRAGIAGAFVNAAYSLGTGTTLDLNNFDQTIASLDGSGAVTLGSGTLTVGSGTYSGAISGTGGLTKVGPGTLTLSSANSYTGFTRVGGGTLSISQDLNLGAAPGVATPGSLTIDGGTLSATASFAIATNRGIVVGPNIGIGFGTIDVASGQTVTYGGVMANTSGTGGLIKTGAGTLTLSGANTYTGATQIDNGVLSISAGGNIPTGTAPIILNGGTLRSTNAGTSTTTINATHPIVIGSIGGATSGTIEVTNAAAIQIYQPAAAGTIITSANGAGTGTLIKTGPGIFRVTQNGATAISSVQKLVVLGGLFQGNIDTSFGAAPGAVLLDAITLDGGGITMTGGNPLVANRGITLGAAGGRLDVNSNMTVNGRITGIGSLTITRTGAVATNYATLLNSNNTYSGGTLINTNATLQFSGSNRLPLTGDLSFIGAGSLMNLSNLVAATGAIGSHSQTVNALNSTGGLGTISNAHTGTATLTVGNGGGTGAYSGLIQNGSGTVALTKTGAGTQTLTGANTYSGGTIINGGTLLVNNTTGSGTGAGTVTVNASGTLGGSGIINGAVTVSGANATLAPGNSIGTLTVNSSVTLGASSIYSVELNATGSQADLLKSTSLILSGGSLNVNLTGTLGGSEVFLIAQNVTAGTTAVSGQFAGLANGSSVGTFGGVPLYVYYDSSNIVAGVPNTEPGAIILSPTPVPEPTTILAIGTLAFGAVGGIRRLRRRETVSPAIAA